MKGIEVIEDNIRCQYSTFLVAFQWVKKVELQKEEMQRYV